MFNQICSNTSLGMKNFRFKEQIFFIPEKPQPASHSGEYLHTALCCHKLSGCPSLSVDLSLKDFN